jgi:hypothetical protein
MHCLAAFHAGRTDVVLSHDSVAAIHGIPTLGRYPTLVHVLATMEAGTRTEHGYRKHATWRPNAHREAPGTLVLTDFLRTVVEFACTTTFAGAVTALDWALQVRGPQSLDPISEESIRECADELQIRRGRKQLHMALDLADPLSESPGESLSRVVIHQLGFPAPTLQQVFSDRRGLIGRVDFWWPDHNLIGEFDGIAKYVREDYAQGKSAAQLVIAGKGARRPAPSKGSARRALGMGYDERPVPTIPPTPRSGSPELAATTASRRLRPETPRR